MTLRPLILSLLFACAFPAFADDEARTALIVGVENYHDLYFKELGAPVADARALQAKLKTLGFQADLLVNPTRRQLIEAVDAFGSTLAKRGGIGLFYFSGHGAMKSDESGANFLIPASTNIRTENDLPEEAFNAQRAANRMKEAKNRLNLVFLDACRNHNLPKGDGAKSGGGGLAAMRGASGLMFFFATQPGEVAIEDTSKRSLFTTALLKHMDSPGLSFMDMMGDVTAETERASLNLSDKALRQSPFISGTLSGRFYFNPENAGVSQPTPPTVQSVESSVAQAKQMLLKANDTVVFIGDSITHQCLYTQYVEDYFYTRFPTKRLHFYNAGNGGDRVQDVLQRFDEDVATQKPTYVSVFLGLNDGGYTTFDQSTFDTFRNDMGTLLDRIRAIRAKALVLSPTMFDGAQKRLRGSGQEPRDSVYNTVMRTYGERLRGQAEARGLGFADLWLPLNQLTDERRKSEPNWTMLPDGVHPNATGHVAIAVSIIDSLVPPSTVSAIRITSGKGPPQGTAEGGNLSGLEGDSRKLRFSFSAQALPWVLPEDAAEGFAQAHAGARLSRETLLVEGLSPGRYDLRIDGNLVGTYPDISLTQGIDLQENHGTPQYQQASKIAGLNKERNNATLRPLRDLYSQLKVKRRELKRAEESKDPQRAKIKRSFDEWHAEMTSKVAQLLSTDHRQEQEIHTAAQPAPRSYELSPAK